jgi:lambda repressor-like predicted transcriptional regulator
MYAISIRQPWAYAILNLGKNVENRTWLPPQRVIGKRIAIHVSKTLPKRYLDESLKELTQDERQEKKILDAISDTLGKIVAVATLSGAFIVQADGTIPTSRGIVSLNHTGSRYASGPACWCLDNVVALKTPIKAVGHLGLFTLTHSEEEILLQQVANTNLLQQVNRTGTPQRKLPTRKIE